jgi:mono/diheme cytochrome c family protein
VAVGRRGGGKGLPRTAALATLEEGRGQIGPNLDESTLDLDAVVTQVEEGGGGMPPFGGQLSEEDIANVAAFVVASQG